MKFPLPIDPFIPGLLETLKGHSSLVLTAAPGAGKTTRLPPELCKLTDKKIIVLEPRRIAAISAAQRVAEENGWELGREVGYQVRFENKSSRHTRLLFLTEALLLRRLIRDSELKDVGCVVLDEFHERSLHVDLALGALKELQELSRPDLKVVVMSATLNPAPLASFLSGAPVADIPGKLFPMQVRYEEKSQILRVGPEFTERLSCLVKKAYSESEGDLLCFLPGRGEIERLREALDNWSISHGATLFPLHGQLNLQEQRAALAPLPRGRKVILATNVAESSLTVEGVRVVVDSGLQRLSQLHPRTGFSSLDLVRISKASATQRGGRAARQGPGLVYRAWMPYDELSMKDFDPPEVQRSDLSESLLLLSALGVTRFETFSWFEAPPARAFDQAVDFLQALGAIESDGKLTSLGRSLRELPVHPRLAKLLLAGKERGMSSLASELAALLSEPGSRLLGRNHEAENDLWLRWLEWKRVPSHPRHRLLSRVAEQLSSLLGSSPEEEQAPLQVLEEKIPELLLSVYFDRLCKRRRDHEPQAKMVGGRGVKLHPDSSVRSSSFFLAIELSEGRDAAETLVFQAVGLPASLVEKELEAKAIPAKHLEWDEEKNRFFVLETLEWNGLPIGREHRRPADLEELEGRLADLAFNRFDRLLAANPELAAWLARLRFLCKFQPRFLPLGEAQIREALELACFGERSLTGVFEKSLVSFFESLLSPEQKEALGRECPSHWVVPTGNRLRIEYSEEQGPLVEVRLQELFGLARAPRIAGEPLTLVLLGPNFRPVQVTRDLESFWKNGYPEVRKELRARYPKHSWPEKPLEAAPQSKGRPRNL